MKNCFALVILLMIGSPVFAADSGPELRGIVTSGGVTKFSLVDKSNDTTRWVAVGQSFAGYKVVSYDPATGTVTVTKDGVPYRLRLSSTRIKEAPPMALMPTAPADIVQAVRNNL